MKEYLIEQFELKHLYFDTKFIKLLSDEDIKILYQIIPTNNKSDNNISTVSYNYEIDEAYKNNKYDCKRGTKHSFNSLLIGFVFKKKKDRHCNIHHTQIVPLRPHFINCPIQGYKVYS